MEVTSQQLCDDIMRVMEQVKACHVQAAEHHGLTKVQLFAIYAIAHREALPMGQMAEVLHCDASNVTGIVDRLAAQGIIVREECPTDRRAKRIKLTEKGEQVAGELQASIPAWLGCDKLTAEERGTLSRLIQKMEA
jgi:DNA-binding MarR family transcriptional regulator